MRCVLGRWMRMVTIPNQSSVAKAWQEFDDDGRMKPSPFYDRVVDVMEELFKFTLLVRGRSDYLVDRYSERKGAAAARAISVAAGVTEDMPAATEMAKGEMAKGIAKTAVATGKPGCCAGAAC